MTEVKLTVGMSVCLSVCLSACLPVCMSHVKLLTVKHGNICMLSLLVFTICRGQTRTAFWDVDGHLKVSKNTVVSSAFY